MIISATDNPQEIHRRVSMTPQQRERVMVEALADMAARLETVLRDELSIAGSRHVGGYRNWLLTRRAYLPGGDLHSQVLSAYRLAMLDFARRYWFAVHGDELPHQARQTIGQLATEAASAHARQSLAEAQDAQARANWPVGRTSTSARQAIDTLARWVEAQTTTAPLAD